MTGCLRNAEPLREAEGRMSLKSGSRTLAWRVNECKRHDLAFPPLSISPAAPRAATHYGPVIFYWRGVTGRPGRRCWLCKSGNKRHRCHREDKEQPRIWGLEMFVWTNNGWKRHNGLNICIMRFITDFWPEVAAVTRTINDQIKCQSN